MLFNQVFKRGRALTASKLLKGVAGKEQVTFFGGRGVAVKKNTSFSLFHLFFVINIKYSQQNIDHSKPRIGDQKLSVELYV